MCFGLKRVIIINTYLCADKNANHKCVEKEWIMNEVGYHGTCSKYRYDIEKNGLDPIKSKYRADHWLGQGVYFFDDYDKALWWASTTSLQNDNCGGIVFESIIEAPDVEVLNLDLPKQLDDFITETLKTLDEIKKNCAGSMPILDDDKFRAVFFDYYKQQNGISVIIGTFQKEFAGYTTKRNNYEKQLQKKIMNIIGIKFQERQICVSKKECIKSTKLIYNEEEEVI